MIAHHPALVSRQPSSVADGHRMVEAGLLGEGTRPIVRVARHGQGLHRTQERTDPSRPAPSPGLPNHTVDLGDLR
jgi:hypothetical protein